MNKYTMSVESINELADGSALITFDMSEGLSKEYVKVGLKKVLTDAAIKSVLESKNMDIVDQLKMVVDETGINMVAASEIEKLRQENENYRIEITKHLLEIEALIEEIADLRSRD